MKKLAKPAGWLEETEKALPLFVPETALMELLGLKGNTKRTLRRWRASGRICGLKTSTSGAQRVLYPRAEVMRLLSSLAGAA